MKQLKLSVLILLVVALFLADSCKKRKTLDFTGTVFSNSGAPVGEAVVEINKEKTTTNKDGTFLLAVPAEDATTTQSFLVSVRKFGFGLYSRHFPTPFKDKNIYLSEGSIVEFDPSTDAVLVDKNSVKNPYKPALLSTDTAKLFKTVPLVYDSQGKLIDIGYPAGMEHVLDYLKLPVVGSPGIQLMIPAGSLVNGSGQVPSAGTKLKAALSTVDFFNPDGMPGDFVVKTEKGLAYMESYGAGTIEITDGNGMYQLKDGAKAKVVIPVYPIHLQLHEKLEPQIPLLHFNEAEGYWVQTGTGYLNADKTAYEGEVGHLSVLNMDLVKVGQSKCFKIRQLVKQGSTDNSAGFLTQYRAEIIVPPTASSPFTDSSPRNVDESTGCVPVPVGGNNSTLHPITRIPLAATNIVVVFLSQTTTDILGISVGTPAGGSLDAATAVAQAANCSVDCATPGTPCNPTAANQNPIDTNEATASNCNNNAPCFLQNCGFVPFNNVGVKFKVVGIAKGAKGVRVKYVNDYATGSMRITCRMGSCATPGVTDFTYSKCAVGSCSMGCTQDTFDYTASGTGAASLLIEVFGTGTMDCTGIPSQTTCVDITVL